MNARHAARELALLTLYQLESQGKSLAEMAAHKPSLEDLMLSAVRTLTDQAAEAIDASVTTLMSARQLMGDTEWQHPDNLELPFDAALQPVSIPNTQEMAEKLDQCLLAAEALAEALRIPEWAALARREQVRDYALQLVGWVAQHPDELDTWIEAASQEWRLDRLVKLDRALLRLAAAELQYGKVDTATVINEAVELAKRFSTEESYRFINGILGNLANQLEASKLEQAAQEAGSAPC